MSQFPIPNVSMRLITVIIAAVVLHLAMGIGFMFCGASAKEEQEKDLASLKTKWESEDYERRKQQDIELTSKFGTNDYDRIGFDPRLDIQVALKKLFAAVTPETYVVQVELRRFNEYSVVINTFNMPEEPVLAEQIKEVFSRIDPAFVYEVVYYDDINLKIIDRLSLLSVGDWREASVQDIKRKCF